MNYETFIENKTQLSGNFGFDPVFMPDTLFDFQKHLVEWNCRKGRAGNFDDCGLGKTAMQLTWAQNVVQETNGNVLILTPLAVGPQTVREGQKFGIECQQSRDGNVKSKITVTNYQNLHKFDWKDFAGVGCDESSVLKNFDGRYKAEITEFMRKLKYRTLWTATAAPNDYIELGTSSEALGELGYMDMLAKFFKNSQNSLHPSTYLHRGKSFDKAYETAKWRFRGHAEHDFWRWVCSWARAVRRPSDLGFSDINHVLPKLVTVEHVVRANGANPDYLFELPAFGLKEQRQERKRTLQERCETAAQLANHDKPVVAWCHLNDEGHLLEKLIDGAVEVDGNDDDQFKEETFEAFESGQIRALVSKPTIAGYGLNWQHCAHQTFFPSHSFEQWYQAIRRCWRFGQKNDVRVDVVTSEGEATVLANLNRKAVQADEMFSKLVKLINNELKLIEQNNHNNQLQTPSWL